MSQAASDTQSSVQNALAQSERELARRGVSATSGAFGALQRTATQLLATSLAAAKTKARQMGFDQQAAQLDKMVSAAGALYNMGNATEQNAIAAKNAGTGAVGKQGDLIAAQGAGYKSVGDLHTASADIFGASGKLNALAADILGKQGDLEASAGGLIQNAGGLQASAGGLFKDAGSLMGQAAGVVGDAAGVMGNAASLNNQYLQLLSSAFGTLASAHNAAANTKLGAASREISANTGGGSGGSGGGVTVTQGDDDDWMNWKGTGHSETWNHNHNPNFENLIATPE